MNYAEVVSSLKVGQNLRCKYPKHGSMNVLKWHDGTVKATGHGPNGPYALVHSTNGQYRTLRCDKMIDTRLS